MIISSDDLTQKARAEVIGEIRSLFELYDRGLPEAEKNLSTNLRRCIEKSVHGGFDKLKDRQKFSNKEK